MKIISWNINGLRAVLKKGFLDFLETEKPDVLCLQEIKISESARLKELGDIFVSEKIGYEIFWNSAHRPGYSGTAVMVRNVIARSETTRQTRGPGIEVVIASQTRNDKYLPTLAWDDEGRVQVLDLGKFYLVNVYFPNSNHELSRLDFKIDFNEKLLKYFKKLDNIKPLVITGDYNVAHNEIDLARPKENVGAPGFHPREREWMDKFLTAGFVDTFRFLYPDKVQYSWWSYRAGARQRNIGWRIDYFCVSEKLKENIKQSIIMDNILGSDHCPVGLVIG